jgi:hypothetical protein
MSTNDVVVRSTGSLADEFALTISPVNPLKPKSTTNLSPLLGADDAFAKQAIGDERATNVSGTGEFSNRSLKVVDTRLCSDAQRSQIATRKQQRRSNFVAKALDFPIERPAANARESEP